MRSLHQAQPLAWTISEITEQLNARYMSSLQSIRRGGRISITTKAGTLVFRECKRLRAQTLPFSADHFLSCRLLRWVMLRSGVRPSVYAVFLSNLIGHVAHTQRDSPCGSTRRGQRNFRPSRPIRRTDIHVLVSKATQRAVGDFSNHVFQYSLLSTLNVHLFIHPLGAFAPLKMTV